MEAPSEVLDRYAGWSREPVSVYPGRSNTQRLTSPRGETHYLKVVRRGWRPSAEAEAERTIWARSYLPVPRVLQYGTTGENSWLLTEGIAGDV